MSEAINRRKGLTVVAAFNLESAICEVKDLTNVLAEWLRETGLADAGERLSTSITLTRILDDKARELFDGYYETTFGEKHK